MPSMLGGKQPDGRTMLSAGRDGSICEVDILSKEYTRVYQQDDPVTCVSYDHRNGFVWYGTGKSTFNCFQEPAQPRAPQAFNSKKLKR